MSNAFCDLWLARRPHPMLADSDTLLSYSRFTCFLAGLQESDVFGHQAFQHSEQLTSNKKPSARLFILTVSSDLSSAVYNLFSQRSQKQALVLLITAGFPTMAKMHLQPNADNYSHLSLQTIPFAAYLHLSRGKCCHQNCLSRRQNVLGDHSGIVKEISWEIRTVANWTFHQEDKWHSHFSSKTTEAPYVFTIKPTLQKDSTSLPKHLPLGGRWENKPPAASKNSRCFMSFGTTLQGHAGEWGIHNSHSAEQKAAWFPCCKHTPMQPGYLLWPTHQWSSWKVDAPFTHVWFRR